jgi:hypothetical protein
MWIKKKDPNRTTQTKLVLQKKMNKLKLDGWDLVTWETDG